MRHIDFTAINSFLLDHILDEGNISDLLTGIYKRTRLPIISFDISFNMLAYNFPRPFYIQGWEQLATLGILSEEHVLSHDFLALEERILNNRASLIVDTAGVAEYKTAFGPVFVDDRLFAYIATVVEDADSDEVLQLNDLVCHALSLTAKRSPASDYEAVRKLLLEHPVSEEFFTSFSDRQSAPYMFAVIEARSLGEATRNYIQSRLSSYHNCFAVIDPNGDIRLLISAIDPISNRAPEQLDLDRISRLYSCRIGLSDAFASLYWIGTGIKQARLSADVRRISDMGPGVSYFCDCYPEALCLALARSCGHELRCYLKNIARLMDAFPKKHDEYITTLEAYCENGLDNIKTAEALGVHKNTVAYRIGRVAETLHLDVSDSSWTDALMLETKLYHLAVRLKEVGHG